MSQILAKFCLAALAISLTACSDAGGFSTAQMPIINGQPATDEYYGAVVSLSIRADSHYYTYCTGTLIREDAILTAAHCVTDTDDFEFSKFHKNKQIQVITGENAETPDIADCHIISHISLHPDYTPLKPQNDLAIVFLETPIPETEPIPLFEDPSRLPLLAYRSQRVEFVGYGLTENGTDGQRNVAEGFIQKYCAKTTDNACGIETPLGDRYIIPPGSFFHDQEKGGACLGDSGGPVLIKENEAYAIIGVVALGDSDCATYAVTTSVADFTPWIRETLDPPEDGCSASRLYAIRHNSPRLTLLFMVCCALFGLCRIRRIRDKSMIS